MNTSSYFFRKLLTFLSQNGIYVVNPALASYRAAAYRRKVLPAFENKEIELLLSIPERTTDVGKRDYAILLLASFTGIREIDIANLMLESINREEKSITFHQHKTGHLNALPVNKMVMDAICDYIDNARPKSPLPFVFITVVRAYRKLDNKTSVKSIFERNFRKSGIDKTAGDGKSFHAFRRTIGKWLLESCADAQMISQVLGQHDRDVLKRYLPISPESLRGCSLDFTLAPLKTGGVPMRPPVFISNFAPYIEKYITFRCSIGYSESSYQRRMRQFDHFCAERFPDAHATSEEIAMEWAYLQNGESENNQGQRISALKGLLDYLNASGIKSFTIPEGWIHRQKPFMPYLYSDSELICFFRGADSIPKCPLSGPREMIAPVVFRMHFCCGLRPQETIALHRNDVNLNDGILYIADSKGHKDRLVPMSGDLHRLCQKYDRLMSYIFPGREYFFQRSPGNVPITAEWQGDLFRACAKNAGMNFDKYRCPRVYDFRHPNVKPKTKSF